MIEEAIGVAKELLGYPYDVDNCDNCKATEESGVPCKAGGKLTIDEVVEAMSEFAVDCIADAV